MLGEGNWIYNPASGEIIFEPENGFNTNPKPLDYILTDTSTGLSDSATVVITYVNVEPELQITKTSETQSFNASGTTIKYLISVQNSGNITLENVKISDPLTGLSDSIAKLMPGEKIDFTTSYTVKQTDMDIGKIVNTVKAEGTVPGGQTINRTGELQINGVQIAQLEIEKTADLTEVEIGMNDVIGYVIRVYNTGNVTLEDVLVKDPLTGFSVTIPLLIPGESQTFNTTYKVKSADIGKKQIVNVAEASARSSSGLTTGLSKSTAIVAIKDCELLIPEIFSPNGDGNQDYFRVYCIENYPDAKIEVYNRWGNIVFTKEHYGNTSVWGDTDAWWDGYSDHKWTAGKEKLPSATYYYILFLNDGSKPRNGYIFLNR